MDNLHLPIPPSNSLTTNSHSPPDLYKAALTALAKTTTEIREKQKKDLRQWFWRFKRQVDFKHDFTSQKTTELMLEGWNFLSEIFFLSKLGDTPVIWDADIWDEEQAFGLTGGDGDGVKVWLLPSPRASRGIAAETLLETMAHEAAHAFLRRYTCRCFHCGVDWCLAATNTTIGVTGHGITWQGLTTMIEDVSEELFGFRLDLGRPISAKEEHAMLDIVGAVGKLFGGVDPREHLPGTDDE